MALNNKNRLMLSTQNGDNFMATIIKLPNESGIDGKLYKILKDGTITLRVVDSKSIKVIEYINLPTNILTSRAFCGKNLDVLAVTTTNLNVSLSEYKNAGFTHLIKLDAQGRKPYRFGENND